LSAPSESPTERSQYEREIRGRESLWKHGPPNAVKNQRERISKKCETCIRKFEIYLDVKKHTRRYYHTENRKREKKNKHGKECTLKERATGIEARQVTEIRETAREHEKSHPLPKSHKSI
jgi:hypothetical protein